MIVCYLHGIGVTIPPLKANAPLIVDADAVLARSVASEPLQPVPLGRPKVLERICRIKDEKLPQGRAQQLRRQAPDSLTLKEGLGISIRKRFDHRR